MRCASRRSSSRSIPRRALVLQLAAPKEIVDLLPLGGDQLKFDLIVKLGEVPVVVVTVVSVLDVFEPVALVGA